MRVAFLCKPDKYGTKEAITKLRQITTTLDVYTGNLNETFPEELKENCYDMIISYLSPWIIPKNILEKTRKWNINFHPGPPDYPGIGCFNFAIYDNVKCYGATCHIMEPTVDSGQIIGVKRFRMSTRETVQSLSQKTYKSQLKLFNDIISHIGKYGCLPQSDEIWTRKPYKREDLEALATIGASMTTDEIEHIIRSTYFAGKPAPFVELGGYRFEYNPRR